METPWGSRRPTRVPAVGAVLRLTDDDYRYGSGGLTLRVHKVRQDLSNYYGGQWVWVEGVEILRNGQDGNRRSALVRCAVLS